DSIPKWVIEMDEYLGHEKPSFPLFKKFEKFMPAEIEDAITKKSIRRPKHAFFDACEAYTEAIIPFDPALIWLKKAFFDYVAQQLPKAKRQKGIMYFDDLLTLVRDALSVPGAPLLDSARQRFCAALIDEFQDTDPIQYKIFNQIFGSKTMFLIGDPKQAIYRFRGADIFAYMDACSSVSEENQHTLEENHRSDAGLVRAINTLFSFDNPFVFKKIAFHPITAAHAAPDHENRLRLCFLPSVDKPPINKEDAKKIIARHVTTEISRLLSKDSPEKPKDIAVLTSTNAEAMMIRDQLKAVAIPGVIYSDKSVFASAEASEMQYVLTGIASPLRYARVKAALMTRIMGKSIRDIFDLSVDDAKWEQVLSEFIHYHDTWEQNGFMYMFERLMHDYKTREKILGLRGGDRALTNIIQIAELLNNTEIQEGLQPVQMVSWLSRQRSADHEKAANEYQIRLESDEDCVKVLTIYKSKGLEFPIVFVPFAWSGSVEIPDPDKKDDSGKAIKPFFFHDSTRNTMDLGSDQVKEHLEISHTEELAEAMRLLYVSVTRASKYCYLYWGKINTKKLTHTSGLSYLLHTRDKTKTCGISSSLYNTKKMDAYEMYSELEDICAASADSIVLEKIKEETPERYVPAQGIMPDALKRREFKQQVDTLWQISSFSSLSSGVHSTGPQDYDRSLEPGDTMEPAKKDIFTFPRGTSPGIMMHKIFEDMGFTSDEATKKYLVKTTLDLYGFDTSWTDAIYTMVSSVLSARLDGFCLKDIPGHKRLNELRFFFPVQDLSTKAIKDTFKAFPDEIPQGLTEGLSFSEIKGFMQGFIDMVFEHKGKYYLVDWKSNYLGPGAQDYNQDALEKDMISRQYILQYTIYSLALHLYLKKRVPSYDHNTHFGGVFYIFLRGVDSHHPDCGIYRARPSLGLLKAMEKTITGEIC
ncbi:MAG: exodeoxyribonuclease V subunit beta, partial [Thermodesulfobacteriota bacterium]|nr:exodeoxyribonuclease V subunit beta [Thermodesulfobacteriota bacterium]